MRYLEQMERLQIVRPSKIGLIQYINSLLLTNRKEELQKQNSFRNYNSF